MRNYLFRGKEAGTGKWVFGGYSPYHEDGPPCIVTGISEEGYLYGSKVYPETVGQFTDFIDKEGTK